MTLPTALNRFSLSRSATAQVTKFLAGVAASELDAVTGVLVRAAESDGDKNLDDAELKAVVDVFTKAGSTKAGLVACDAVLSQLEDAANVNGVTVHFSDALETRLITELNAAVTRAAGRPLDINMMIFEFQSDKIEETIADLATKNNNVQFRIIGDAGQASAGGGNALPSLLKRKLANVSIKYKKDFSYTWDKASARPLYNHNSTKGLNHHKGIVSLIDGAPDRLVTGSFNWSTTANTKNYEDLAIVRSKDSGSRRLIAQFVDEFTGFFNNDDATLAPNAFAAFRREQTNTMRVANGLAPFAPSKTPAEPKLVYKAAVDTTSFDVNGYRKSDSDRLTSVTTKAVARAVAEELAARGRYSDVDDLVARVPVAARYKAALGMADFGSASVSVNTGSAEELECVGLSAKDAAEVVAYRETNGDFADMAALAKVVTVRSDVAEKLNATDAEAFFNSRPFNAAKSGTGYGAEASKRSTVVTLDGGLVGTQAAVISWGANDLFNSAAKGQTVAVAMYGMSPGSSESVSLLAAAKRGVTVRVVVNDQGNDSAIAALLALQKTGLDVDVRIQKAKTMHEKFGVVGDDVFFGSANFSESSSTKHSENRVTLKNQPRLALRFNRQFDLLWERSKAPVKS